MTKHESELIGFPELSQRADLMNLVYNNIDLWTPDSEGEFCPAIDFTGKFQGFNASEVVELSKLSQGSIIYFTCTNPHAFYSIKTIEQGKVKVWRDRGDSTVGTTTGLVSAQENLVVWDQNSVTPGSNEVIVYPGVLFAKGSKRIHPRIAMPYFDYDEQLRVKTPTDTWADFITQVWVKENRPS